MGSKVALTAVVVVGSVAMPAAAQAVPHWTQGGTTLGSTPTATTSDGTLTLNAFGGFRLTCGVHATGTIWNDAVTGVGKKSIAAVTFANPCSTNVPGCTLTAAATGLPWAGSLTAVGAVIRDSIAGVSASWTYWGTCPAGIPTGVPIFAAGVLGPVVGAGGILTFDGGAPNTVSGPLGSATVTGTMTVTTPTGISAAL